MHRLFMALCTLPVAAGDERSYLLQAVLLLIVIFADATLYIACLLLAWT
jgi:hypothetical protein